MYGDSQDQTSGVYAVDEDGGLTLLHEYQDGEYSLDDLVEEFGFCQTQGDAQSNDTSIVLVAREIRELKLNADAYSFDYNEGFIAMCLDIERFASGADEENLRLISID